MIRAGRLNIAAVVFRSGVILGPVSLGDSLVVVLVIVVVAGVARRG